MTARWAQAWFARICAHLAYEMGCREVVMNWSDDLLAREKYLYAADAVFDSVHSWTADFFEKVSSEGAAWLAIHAAEPGKSQGLRSGADSSGADCLGQGAGGISERETNNEFPWCVCSIPTESWARRVFPELDTAAAMEKLWETILNTAYVDDGDAVANWRAHVAELQRRTEVLNSYRLKTLHYTNSLGTDLTVALPRGPLLGRRRGKVPVTTGVLTFPPTSPRRRCYTLPVKTGVRGRGVCLQAPVAPRKPDRGFRL